MYFNVFTNFYITYLFLQTYAQSTLTKNRRGVKKPIWLTVAPNFYIYIYNANANANGSVSDSLTQCQWTVTVTVTVTQSQTQ